MKLRCMLDPPPRTVLPLAAIPEKSALAPAQRILSIASISDARGLHDSLLLARACVDSAVLLCNCRYEGEKLCGTIKGDGKRLSVV